MDFHNAISKVKELSDAVIKAELEQNKHIEKARALWTSILYDRQECRMLGIDYANPTKQDEMKALLCACYMQEKQKGE
jgi:hypothetical protein